MFQLVAMNIYQAQALTGVPSNQLKRENIETLYLLSALKETVQINTMPCYGKDMNIKIFLTYLL